MADITDTTTAHVADLIKIAIKPAELPVFTGALSHALDPVSALAELATEAVDVLSHPTGLVTQGVADTIMPGLSTTAALHNAAQNGRTALDYFKVVKVVGN